MSRHTTAAFGSARQTRARLLLCSNNSAVQLRVTHDTEAADSADRDSRRAAAAGGQFGEQQSVKIVNCSQLVTPAHDGPSLVSRATLGEATIKLRPFFYTNGACFRLCSLKSTSLNVYNDVSRSLDIDFSLNG
ncbi:hypothetical protein EVAR_16043_1 [Eumeta japonica]|uniref:Uncharacterized protein n=1 Tax=Eumeta variegata TaxID=151549 RepID=A0A4C1VYZ5_EUMVA|nr:hypothetical protein EVAR_16043_1 [Eumeta japonica]